LFLLAFFQPSLGHDVQLAGSVDALAVTLKNPSTEPLVLLVYDSPFDTHSEVFHAPIFDVEHSSGMKAIYSGIIIKRKPVLSDFVTIRPGQSLTALLNLHKGYNFPAAGVYTVTLATNVLQFQGEMGASVDEALSQLVSDELVGSISVTVNVASLPISFPPINNQSGLLGNPNPKTNCDANQASQIRTSGSNAITASQRGFNYLSGSCLASKTYYITWFGVCDNTRWTRVRNTLSAVTSGLQASYPVDCAGSSCTPNTYAYVYPTDTTHTVYVCGYFWRVPTGNCIMDSQPGTLIHEMSHFNNVAGTQDVTYGITNCQNLAKSNPAQATVNADNYCFFTDSCPS